MNSANILEEKLTQETICSVLRSAPATTLVLECISALCQDGSGAITSQTGMVDLSAARDIFERRSGAQGIFERRTPSGPYQPNPGMEEAYRGEDNPIKGFPDVLRGLETDDDPEIFITHIDSENYGAYAVLIGSRTYRLVGILKFPPESKMEISHEDVTSL